MLAAPRTAAFSVAVAAYACGGETLHVGSDRLALQDGGPDPCTAARGQVIPEARSINERLPAAIALLTGRWRTCPNSAGSARAPGAVEFTMDTAYVLVDVGDGTYRRVDAGIPMHPSWSLRNDSLVIDFPRPATYVLFEDGPIRMTWNDEVLLVKQ